MLKTRSAWQLKHLSGRRDTRSWWKLLPRSWASEILAVFASTGSVIFRGFVGTSAAIPRHSFFTRTKQARKGAANERENDENGSAFNETKIQGRPFRCFPIAVGSAR